MPDLDTNIHKEMLETGRNKRSFMGRCKWAYRIFVHKGLEERLPKPPLGTRISKMGKVLFGDINTYGLEWGDPEIDPSLVAFKKRFFDPYIKPGVKVVEVGPGGGRWTRYIVEVTDVYGVDYYQELIDELTRTVKSKRLTAIKNNGSDFPGIEDNSIDFVFSFGVFVHLDLHLIDQYLGNMKRILKPGSGIAVIHYSDSNKPMSAANKGFSDNTPEKMRKMLEDHGYEILEEDENVLNHSAVVRFRLPE